MANNYIFSLTGATVLIKLLFIRAYRSTDFEVHRNWLAITHSLPLNRWYIEETSEWTLDYPPLFAWFEWFLSFFAKIADPEMLKISNLNYASNATVIFQRLSVIATDLVFIFAIVEFNKMVAPFKKRIPIFDKSVIPLFLIFNFGLFIVDHIHFQYNGFLFGFLLLSITRMLQGRSMEAAFWFSILLNLKHIFLYMAPAYFVYLLRTHCFKEDKPTTLKFFSIWKFLGLGSVVSFVCLLSLGPFIYMNQTGQVLTRLFPFKRGLVHAYWAPNFWALYSGLDKVLTFCAVVLGMLDRSSLAQASMTGGMVQEYSHVVLPSIPPIVTMLLTLLAMVPNLAYVWFKPSNVAFLHSLILCSFSSFLFGWHVHEKAILMVVIPMTLLVWNSQQEAKLYLMTSITGFYSLFPLIFSPMENILKVMMWLSSTILTFHFLTPSYRKPSPREALLPIVDYRESLYLLGLIPLGLFNSLGVWLLGLDQRLPFLPLMLTSLYCSLGLIYSWIRFYWFLYKQSGFDLFKLGYSADTGTDTLTRRKKSS